MKGKKLSAFAVLHNKTLTQNQQRLQKKDIKNSVNGSVQKKKKISPSNYDKKVGLKESASYMNLRKSPILVSERSKSCPNVPEEQKLSAKRKRQSPPSIDHGKIPNETPKSVRKIKKETCSIVSSPSRNRPRASKILRLSETENKDGFSKDAKGDALLQISNSSTEAGKCFDWLIHPVTSIKFFGELWEKKPLLVKRHHSSYYKGIFSCKDLDCILREKTLYFTKNIDVTTYLNGKRETHNPDGRAHAAVVWDYFKNGCSIRLLNPQTFVKSVWKLNCILQEFFSSCVGANVYLTPPGSQGFAPHYDDIEAFVLQLEGRKRWKLYNPRSTSETLPRFSSENLTPADLDDPILNIELEPGDLLYFPRGTIHQASTPDDTHSLHITVSTYQRNTWSDFLEKLIPRALQIAYEEDLEFRESLPCNYLNHVGIAHSENETFEREAFMNKLNHLLMKLIQCAPVDACADQMAKNYIHDCLPPLLTKDEKIRTIHNGGECWQDGKVVEGFKMELGTTVRLLRANILRLVTEDETIRVYHSVDNSREYHGEEPQSLEISPEFAPAIEYLVHSYPKFVAIKEFPLEEPEEKVALANALFDKGLLLTEKPIVCNEI